ncbi:hypothetical protein CDAR_385971, partial [Caerostris darwini]
MVGKVGLEMVKVCPCASSKEGWQKSILIVRKISMTIAISSSSSFFQLGEEEVPYDDLVSKKDARRFSCFQECPTEEIKGEGESDNKDGSPLSIRKQLDSLGGNAKEEEEAWLARWILK